MPDIDYEIKPSRTDIAKLELFLAQIEEVSCQTPVNFRNYDAEQIAGYAEIELITLGVRLREKIAKLKGESNEPIVPFPTVAEQRMAA